ncbi:hypothetical protein [Streptomyces sp. NPDC097610]|uniref:hypothetical protein n=1 Tax=Streptomyces sp. NPDC097610 TaxID=3157227 RepID=UPI003329AA6B
MRHAIDPELVPVAEMLPTLSHDDVEATRRTATEHGAMAGRPETPVPVDVRDATVPGPEGAPEVPVRI